MIPEPNLRNQFDKYNFISNKIDWNGVNDKLETIDWEDLNDDVPDLQINITGRIIDIIVKDFIPLKSVKSQHKKRSQETGRFYLEKGRKLLKILLRTLKRLLKIYLILNID